MVAIVVVVVMMTVAHRKRLLMGIHLAVLGGVEHDGDVGVVAALDQRITWSRILLGTTVAIARLSAALGVLRVCRAPRSVGAAHAALAVHNRSDGLKANLYINDCSPRVGE